VYSGEGIVSTRLEGCYRLVSGFTQLELKSSHRTPASLSFPPHIIALGSIYTASMLVVETTQPVISTPPDSQITKANVDIAQMLGRTGTWEERYSVTAGEVDG